MPTTTDPGQRTPDALRPDRASGPLNPRPGSTPLHSERQTGPLPREPFSPARSGEHVTGRLRPIAPASIHDTVVPNKEVRASSLDVMRKLSPAEFSTAMAHFYRGEIQR